MDGVLSDARARQHYLTGSGRKDWKGFFDAAGDDLLIEEIAQLLEVLDPRVVVVLLTGRPLRVRQLTLDWLEHHHVRWDLLVMRPTGSYSAALEFKRQTVAELRKLGFDLRLAVEDDARNQAMFREEGLPCVYIHSGYYE
jgi:hypothetical protein